MKSAMVWARISEDLREIVRKLADSQEISLSEYVRQLILRDLDERSIFTTQLKKEISKERNEGKK